MNITTIVLIVLVVVVLWFIFAYNRLVRLRNRVREAWSDIDIQLKRRYDLIPNLVESVKGYMRHEAGVFQKVTEARTRAMQATGAAKAGAEDQLSGALKSLFAVAENYPQLKANENFSKLQDELTDTEDKIQAARRLDFVLGVSVQLILQFGKVFIRLQLGIVLRNRKESGLPHPGFCCAPEVPLCGCWG